jgi:hypothetical protein
MEEAFVLPQKMGFFRNKYLIPINCARNQQVVLLIDFQAYLRAGLGQSEQDTLNRTEGTRQKGQESQNRYSKQRATRRRVSRRGQLQLVRRKGHPEQDIQNRTSRTGHPEQGIQISRTGQRDIKNIIQNRTPIVGYPEQDCALLIRPPPSWTL